MSTLMTSSRRTTASLALITVAATLALSACGNKGPLVLPDKPKSADAATPAVPAGEPAPAATPAPTTPAIDETASPLPPSSPPPAADPVLNQSDDDGNGR